MLLHSRDKAHGSRKMHVTLSDDMASSTLQSHGVSSKLFVEKLVGKRRKNTRLLSCRAAFMQAQALKSVDAMSVRKLLAVSVHCAIHAR